MNNSEKKNNSAPKINSKVTVKNYKCFDEEGAYFERIKPINVIIGKNNSGKSSLIELAQFICSPYSAFFTFKNKGSDKDVEVIVDGIFSINEIESWPSEMSTLFINPKKEVNLSYQIILNEYNGGGHQSLIKFLGFEEKEYNDPFSTFKIEGLLPLYKEFIHIPAERDILPINNKEYSKSVNFPINGKIATTLVRECINNEDFGVDRNEIEKDLLNALNEIVNPDILISTIEISESKDIWEIKLVNRNGIRVPLSDMGSGIRTIFLVLLNLMIAPKKNHQLRKVDITDFVFAFEELENNLHPAIQRRLYEYIKKYSEKYGCYFFLTTHSNVVIDVFGTYEHAQIIHVEHDGVRSKTTTILHDKDSKKVLRDLGVKASDLLQSNGVIWVEGPSDRNYLNKWIQLRAPKLQEGLHYSIMFYGGRLLANLSFDFEWFNKEVIPLMKINTNSFVIIDRDGKDDNAKLNTTKERIKDEIGEGNYWITKGREIENYLSDDVVKNWLSSNYEVKLDDFSNKINTKLEDSISTEENDVKLKYNSSKTVYSSEIAEFIDKDSLDFLDLKERLDELIERIIEWNE